MLAVEARVSNMTTLTSRLGSLTEVSADRHWSETDVRKEVGLRAVRFRSLGLKRGDRVLLHFGNRLEFFAELLAVWGLGGCVIPVDDRLTPFEVSRLAKAADARFSVVDDSTDPGTLNELAGAQTIHTSDLDPASDKKSAASEGLHLDDDALILFTSGTTGNPKGVVHTHRSLNARWITLRMSLGIRPYRKTLCMLPTHFGHGLIGNCLFPWLFGCDLFIAPPFKPGMLMQLGPVVDEHQITFLSSVPSMWNLVLRTAKSPIEKSLERIHIGSAPLSADLWTQVQTWSGVSDVINAYGITETGNWVGGASSRDNPPEDGLLGTPWGASVAVLEARTIDDLMEKDRHCKIEEPGMIWLKTPALMKGYFERDDLTSAVVRDGWFVTGDIGILDSQGRLVLRGREREEINKGGTKVFPADIDSVVQQFDRVVDVCTFAVDDALYGENVAMAVVLQNSEARTVAGLHDWIGRHLAEHKRPERWYLLQEIPRTSRGKLNRENVSRVCREQEPLKLGEILREYARSERPA